MQKYSLPVEDYFSQKYELYGKMLFRISMVYLGKKEDAEEAVQETFIKLINSSPKFNNLEHEKAWLIRVITNICKNMISSLWRKRVISMESIENLFNSAEDLSLIENVLKLPFKYKTVIHLYYYEDYSVRQISDILNLSESAVKMRLQRGRELLKFDLQRGE
jgi:RNA polymerase sigma-70 factor (ECF subfamily)